MKYLIKHKYYLMIFTFGICTYFPTFFNGFVWDDIVFILNNPQIQQLNFSILFDNVYTTNSIYRPFLAVYFSLLYSLFQTNAFFYHFIQLFLHIFGTVLIFHFLQQSIQKRLALLLSLLFLVHPINSEAVYWISSIQSQLLTITGFGALLLVSNKNISHKNYVFIGLLLLINILSNENGMFYLLFVTLYTYLFHKGKYKRVLFIAFSILCLYIYMRFISNAYNYVYGTFPMGKLSVIERLQHIPIILQYYIVTFLAPINIMIDQLWVIKKFTFQNFYLPLSLLLFVLLSYGMFFIGFFKKQQKLLTKNTKIKKNVVLQSQDMKYFIYFSLWTAISLGTYIQIIPLNITIAERWFYITFPGLLGLIGIMIKYSNPKIQQYKNHILILYVIILLLFSLRTFVRGFDWKDERTLFSHDQQLEPDNYFIVASLSNIYMNDQNYSLAIPYLEKSIKINGLNGNTLNSLGYAYQMTGEYGKALETYQKAITPGLYFKEKADSVLPYINLANLYMQLNRQDKVIALLDDSLLMQFPNMELYMLRATAKANNNDYDGAVKDAEFIYIHFTQPQAEYFYRRIVNEREEYKGKNN